MTARVLLIGHGLFRDGLARLLAEQPLVSIVGEAGAWAEAQTLVAGKRPDVLIVDHAAADLVEADLAPLLEAEAPAIKVIYLTLADNKMIVHNRQQVADVTVEDLLSALQIKPRPRRKTKKAKG
jgi:DNA-binding NarL/FixJ family response regulator